MKKVLISLIIFSIIVLQCAISVSAKNIDVIEVGEVDNPINTDIEVVDDSGDYILMSGMEDMEGEILSSSTSSLPSVYSSKTLGYTTPVKDQYYTGDCWAYSGTSLFELYLNKNGLYSDSFSPLHCAYVQSARENNTGWVMNSNWLTSGGNIDMVIGYYTSFSGARRSYLENLNILDINKVITESISNNYKSVAKAFDENSNTIASMDSYVLVDVSDRNNIKQAIYDYGAVSCAFIVNYDAFGSNSATYYCGDTTAPTAGGHAVIVVGWDDNYSRDNFDGAYKPSSDGAWICQNSWGNYTGDEGFFYMSYEETTSFNPNNSRTIAFTSSHNNSNYESLYNISETTSIFDYWAPWSSINKIYYLNKFEFGEDELLQYVYFDSDSKGARFDIYYYPCYDNAPDYNNKVLLKSGYVDHVGYNKEIIDNYSTPSGSGYIGVALTKTGNSGNTIGLSYNISGVYTYDKEFESDESLIYCEWYGTIQKYDIGVRDTGSSIIRALTTKNYRYGDADFNKEIEISDATIMQQYLAGEQELLDEGYDLADTDGDGVISITDTTLICYYLSGQNVEGALTGDLIK